MDVLWYYGSIVAAGVLYANTVTILKKVKKEEDTSGNTLIGSICIMFILMSIYAILIR